MTRRGSLAYYLAAWVCGCLFLSLSFLSIRWDVWDHTIKGIFFTYFVSLTTAALPLLVMAFLVRRIAIRFGWAHAWQWAASGALLLLIAIAVFGSIGLWIESIFGTVPYPAALVFQGSAILVMDRGVFSAIPAGMATALVLHAIHRAFEPRESTTI